MHAGFAHIFFNMFAVWMFGRILEQVWGPKRFLFYYLVCGIGAGIIQEVVQYIHYETVLSAYDSVNTGMAIIPITKYLALMGTGNGKMNICWLGNNMPNASRMAYTAPEAPTVVIILRYSSIGMMAMPVFTLS